MKLMQRGVALLLSVVLVLIMLLVLFAYEETAYSGRREFLASQIAMLCAGASALAGFSVWGVLKEKKGEDGAPRWIDWLPWLMLLLTQLLLCFHAYFITGWDVRGIVETAYAIAGGEADMHHGYLSQYPNNIPLVMLFAAIIRVVRLLLGNPGMDRCVYVLIAFQCVLNTCTGLLMHWTARRMTGSRRLAWCVSAVYMLFVGLSPWLMIPYSDSVALAFPTAILALYQLRGCAKWEKWVWPGIGLLTGLGYMIKPQVLIAAIAIAMVEIVRGFCDRRRKLCLRRVGSLAAILLLIVGPGTRALIKASPIELRPERSVNMLHYVMMGLNPETNGTYSYDDVVLTYHAQDKQAEQVLVIQKRLEDMGIKGLGEHLKKKTLTNYADGTFAWGMEGEFFSRWIEDKDELLSPYLKSIIHTGGSRYPAYQTAMQCVWLALLMGSALCALLSSGNEKDDALSVAMLSLIGLTLFQLIFEARARYLYIYAPYFVLLGVMGVWHAVGFCLKKTGSGKVKE